MYFLGCCRLAHPRVGRPCSVQHSSKLVAEFWASRRITGRTTRPSEVEEPRAVRISDSCSMSYCHTGLKAFRMQRPKNFILVLQRPKQFWGPLCTQRSFSAGCHGACAFNAAPLAPLCYTPANFCCTINTLKTHYVKISASDFVFGTSRKHNPLSLVQLQLLRHGSVMQLHALL